MTIRKGPGPALIPSPVHVIFYGKGDFADVIKNPEIERFNLDYPGGPDVITGVF